MPNHVTNQIIASPEVIRFLVRERTAEEHAAHAEEQARTSENYKKRTGKDWPYPQEPLSEWAFDFNTFAPMPTEVEGTTVGTGGFEMFDERGWYGWSLSHWGTKWNAYSQSIEDLPDGRRMLQFDTAWSHPGPVMETIAERLGEKFPDEVVDVRYADEDFGNNVGRYQIIEGEVVNFEELSNTDEGNELAAQIKYGQTFAEVQAGWHADEIDGAQRYVFCKRIEKERGIDNGYKVISDEGLEMPEDIKAAITTVEQAESVWADDNEIVKALV
ncbi:MAG: hypothetical protein HOV97_05730 [Nonomuraea sp.]|nr:hypothetical protein [Nonomuraea sp.]